MEEMPSLNMPAQRLKVAVLPLDLPCPVSLTHSGKILTTDKSHGKKSVNRMPRNRLPKLMKYYSPTGERNRGRPLKRFLDT